MSRDAVIARLREHLPVLTERFGVRQLRLFGSMACGTAREDSDIDILVAFGQPPDSNQSSARSLTWKTCWAGPSTW